MDENSCENETSESADGQKAKETKNAPQLETVGITINFERKEGNQVSDRRGSSFEASVSGPSKTFFPAVDNNQEERPLRVVSATVIKETKYERTKGAQSLGQNDREWAQIKPSAAKTEPRFRQNEREPIQIDLSVAESEPSFEQNEREPTQIALLVAESEPSLGPNEQQPIHIDLSVAESEPFRQNEREPTPNVLLAAESTQGPEESSKAKEENTQYLKTPSAPPEEDEVSGPGVNNTPLPQYDEGAEMQPRVRLAPTVEEHLATRRSSVGPPPSYSFVTKQKKKLKPVPSLDPLVTATTPPPSYPGSRAIYLSPEERICNFPSFADPIWRSHSQPALCTRCGIIVLTTTHTHDSIATHVAALALCLFGCWPCCLLPYCMNVCKNTYHHCPICQTYLGLYRPW